MIDLLKDNNSLVRAINVEQTSNDRYHAEICWFAPVIYQEWLELSDGRWLKVPQGCNNIASSVLLQHVDLTITPTKPHGTNNKKDSIPLGSPAES